MTEKLFNEIAAWQQDTFPGGTPDSTLHHLLDEIRELRYSLRLDPASSHEELADCMFLIFGCADRMGMSYQDIQDAIAAKFAINIARKWGKPKENGVVNHVEEPSVIIASPGEGAVIVDGVKNCYDCGEEITHENNGIYTNEDGSDAKIYWCENCYERENGVKPDSALLYFQQASAATEALPDSNQSMCDEFLMR